MDEARTRILNTCRKKLSCGTANPVCTEAAIATAVGTVNMYALEHIENRKSFTCRVQVEVFMV